MTPTRAASPPAAAERAAPRVARRRARLGVAVAVLVALSAPAAAQEEADPWEGFNRSIFAFNEWLDFQILIPVASAWDFVVPEVVQTGFDNAYDTYGMPIVVLNDLLQLKPVEVGHDLARVAVNLTAGMAGFFDVASRIGIRLNDEDFGQTLGYWGVPAGNFVMLPFFGPSNVRDTFGLAADLASQPVSYFAPFYVTLPINTVGIVNRRAIFLEEIAELRETSLDYYVFQRNAWVQNRAYAVEDLEGPVEEEEEDLYYLDDDDLYYPEEQEEP